MKTLVFLGIFISTLSAGALDSSQCPESFEMKLSKSSVYKTSINSQLSGWKKAQSLLLETDLDQTSVFELTERKEKFCAYQNELGQKANLLTLRIQDPEEWEPYFANFLSIQFQIEKSYFNILEAVTEMTPTTLNTNYNTSRPRSKIRVRLKNPNGSGFVNYDIGFTRVDVHALSF